MLHYRCYKNIRQALRKHLVEIFNKLKTWDKIYVAKLDLWKSINFVVKNNKTKIIID